MSLSNTHIQFPPVLVKEGLVLTVHLYVFLPHNESLILYRAPGDKMVGDSFASLKKIPPHQLFYPNSEREAVYQMGGHALSADIKAGVVDTQAVKDTASSMLETFRDGSDLADCMKQAASLVQTLMQNFTNSDSKQMYDDALRKMKDAKTDPLTNHNQLVSTLSVLTALTVGGFAMEDISDLAAAGLVHDLGLSEISHALSESHFNQVKDLSNQEKIIYMRHIDLTLEKLKKQKLAITPGIERIIQQHHENWNGLGFNRYVGNKIFRPARMLRIADDLVSIIQGSNYAVGFQNALNILKNNLDCYDPAMLAALSK